MQKNENLAVSNKKKQAAISITDSINGIGNTIGQMSIAVWAGFLFFNKQLDLGGLLISSNFAFSIFDNLWGIIESLTKINSTTRLRKQISSLTDKKDIQNTNSISVAPSGFKVENLKVIYNNTCIEYPDFSIRHNDKVLILGDSGSGKSTLFKVLIGKIKPSTGTIKYLDERNEIISPNLDRIGYIPQNATLFPTTISNNITMLDPELNPKLEDAIDNNYLTEDIQKFPEGLKTEINVENLNISGGQKQKIVLARATIHQSKLLLLDEATSAIDKNTSTNLIKRLLNNENQTVVFVGHNLSKSVINLFDYVIDLDQKKE